MKYDDQLKEIGAKIIEARTANGLSQEQLGAKIGKSRFTISAIENGTIKLKDLLAIVDALGTDFKFIFNIHTSERQLVVDGNNHQVNGKRISIVDDAQLKKVIFHFNKLDKASQKSVLRFVTFIANESRIAKEKEEEDSEEYAL